MYEFERSVLSKDQLAQKSGKDMGDDVMGATGGEGLIVLGSLRCRLPCTAALFVVFVFVFVFVFAVVVGLVVVGAVGPPALVPSKLSAMTRSMHRKLSNVKHVSASWCKQCLPGW